jgi:hypothetical protein
MISHHLATKKANFNPLWETKTKMIPLKGINLKFKLPPQGLKLS